MVRGVGYAKCLGLGKHLYDRQPKRLSDSYWGRRTGSDGADFGVALQIWMATGEVVSGIVVMRNGENALDVINRVKARIKEIEPGFPEGMKIVPIYDRSELIHDPIGNLKRDHH